jgi:2-amino-4-hydroxy-6-hydroxymethyldihydropteridine diphosphokinase
MPDVYVAIGSNVDPERNLAFAIGELARRFPGIRFSPWYRNRAVGFEGEDFINLVAGFTTELTVQDVIARLQGIDLRRSGLRRASLEAAATRSAEARVYAGTIGGPGAGSRAPDAKAHDW